MEIIHEYDENLPAIFPGGLSIPMQPIPQQQFTGMRDICGTRVNMIWAGI